MFSTSIAQKYLSRTFVSSLLVGLMTIPLLPAAVISQTMVNLGRASTFGVLSAAGITVTGTAVITGDVGTSTGTITGAITASGTTYSIGHGAVADAHTDLRDAYDDADSRTPAVTVLTELGGSTRTSGVYTSSSGTFELTGTLTLDAENDANAVFIFQMGTTLTTAGSSQVVLARGAQWFNVFWQVGSSATLGAGSLFEGNILANTSITAHDGATVHGRILAGAVTTSGAVSLYNNTALPVEFAGFSVTPNRLNAELFWSTVTELNNYGFDIERRTSSTGPREAKTHPQSWTRIGFVPGAGTSNSPRKYNFIDQGLTAGRYQYRIKQIDRDGTIDYSGTVEVDIGLMPRILLLGVNYPNPFHRKTTIEFTLARDDIAKVNVYNILAQEVASLYQGIAEAGRLYQCHFDASQLPYGMYYVRLEANNQARIQKIVYLK